jgi:hypothetical protein
MAEVLVGSGASNAIRGYGGGDTLIGDGDLSSENYGSARLTGDADRIEGGSGDDFLGGDGLISGGRMNRELVGEADFLFG